MNALDKHLKEMIKRMKKEGKPEDYIDRAVSAFNRYRKDRKIKP